MTKLAAITTYRRQTKVDWVVVRRLWLGSIPVALGVAWLASAEMGLGKVAWLSQAVGGVVCLAALGLWFGPALMRRLASAPQRAAPSRWQAPLTIGAGAAVGLAVALTSVGAGTLGSVMLLALYPKRLDMHRLVLADLVHATGLAIVAGLAYAASDLVDWRMLGFLLLGSLPAAVLGSRFAGRLPERPMQQVLAAVLLLIGAKSALG
ncbi:MAG: sulfite exporter TauE/SafE family protein [Thiomonas sp.]